MKSLKLTILTLASALGLVSCSDEPSLGNPVMDVKTDLSDAHFGDSLTFVINASDADVPLSTIHAALYFDSEKVSETVIRTKESGKDYEGKIYVPYLANVPDGTATLRLSLQNIQFTLTEKDVPVHITHADYPHLIFKASIPAIVEGEEQEVEQEFVMKRDAQYEYSFTDKLPQKVKGYIYAPAVDEKGNDIVFGYVNNAIAVGGESGIPFSNSKAGKYKVTFNTFSFAASPFVTLKINGNELVSVDDNNSQVDLNLLQGQQVTLEGFPNINDWWIDPDYFTSNDDGTLTFRPISGSYRIIANQALQYFRVYALNGSEPAKLSDDGSGALWVIGENVGKPSVSANPVGWTTENALCMAQIRNKVYELSVVGGKTVSTNKINFKFFGQMGWGVELKGSVNYAGIISEFVGVGTGSDGHDDGNLYLLDGVTLKDNTIYKFVVDLTAGINAAVFTMTEEGEQPFVEKKVFVNGVKMTTNDNALYTLTSDLNQNATLVIEGVNGLDEYYFDPDYFAYDDDASAVIFRPVNGKYRISLNALQRTMGAVRLNSDGSDATLDGDGHGIWLMGWGVGNPNQDAQFGWTPGAAYSMAEILPGIYQFTGQAGPEKGSSIGQRIRMDYLSFKFFHQNGWGGEFSGDNALSLTGTAADFIKCPGNFELADGTQLEEGATYVITVDITKGVSKGTINFEKK